MKLDQPSTDPSGALSTPTWPGNAYPLGATYNGGGTNFPIIAEVAEKVELFLLDGDSEFRIRIDEIAGYF